MNSQTKQTPHSTVRYTQTVTQMRIQENLRNGAAIHVHKTVTMAIPMNNRSFLCVSANEMNECNVENLCYSKLADSNGCMCLLESIASQSIVWTKTIFSQMACNLNISSSNFIKFNEFQIKLFAQIIISNKFFVIREYT